MTVVAVTKERRAGETRVAMTPDAVKKLIGMGLSVVVESGAGAGASASDADYEAAGATVESPPEDVGEGIVVATLVSATQQRFGLIFNPHFSPQ